MKRFFALIIAFLLLFIMVAPVFSLAANAPYSFVSNVPQNSIYYNALIINGTYTNDVVSLAFSYDYNTSIDCDFSLTSNSSYSTPILYVHFYNGSPNTTITLHFQIINLVSGDSYFENRTASINSSGQGNVYYTNSSKLPILNVYYYCLQFVDNFVSNDTTQIIKVDPFVYFSSEESTSIIYSSIPEPKADARHFYIADYQFLYEIVMPYNDVTYYASSNNNISLSDSGYYVTYNINTSGLTFYIGYSSANQSSANITAYLYRYVLSSGEYVDYQNFTTTSNRLSIPISLSYNYFDYGIWISPFVMDYAPEPQNKLSVVWAEGTSNHNDFVAINTLLTDILSKNLESVNLLTSINNRIQSFLDLTDQYFQWFKNTYYQNWQDYWVAYLQKFTDIYIELNAIDIMMYSYIVPDLQSIKNALVDHTESQPDISAFDDSISEYEAGESFVVSQAENALDDFESQISNASNVLSVNSRGLLFVKQIFENFAFTGLNYYYILFVLVLGSVALLIGRRLR